MLRYNLKWWCSAVLCLALLFAYLYLYISVSRFDRQTESRQQRTVAIVLGAALWNGKPSPALKERCDKAIELFQRGQVQYLLLSGGLESEDHSSEAEAMRQYLTQHGVPDDRLLLEERSTDTRENLLFSRQMLTSRQDTPVYLITHDYHLTRAMLYAKQAGLAVEPVPVHSKVLWPMIYYKTRECLGLVQLYLFHR